MTTPNAQFFFDFIDPLSYLEARELAGLEGGTPPSTAWVGLELRPPPTPLATVSDPSLAERWALAHAEAKGAGVELRPPELVPWSRKAHELSLFAESQGKADVIRMRIFESYLLEGADIGRIDVLVEIGRTAGLDVTETKAVLDVDRFQAAVVAARADALAGGVSSTPTIVASGGRLEGFHNRTTLGTFLGA